MIQHLLNEEEFKSIIVSLKEMDRFYLFLYDKKDPLLKLYLNFFDRISEFVVAIDCRQFSLFTKIFEVDRLPVVICYIDGKRRKRKIYNFLKLNGE